MEEAAKQVGQKTVDRWMDQRVTSHANLLEALSNETKQRKKSNQQRSMKSKSGTDFKITSSASSSRQSSGKTKGSASTSTDFDKGVSSRSSSRQNSGKLKSKSPSQNDVVVEEESKGGHSSSVTR